MSAVTGDSSAIYASRNAWLFSAPFDTTNVVPLSSVDWGDEWGDTWEVRGYTQEGIITTLNIERASIRVDQLLDDVLMPITGRDCRMRSIMAEFTPANLKIGFGQGATTSLAAGVGTRGYSKYALTSTATDAYYSVGVDFQQNDDGEPMRQVVYKGLPVGSPEYSFGVPVANPRVPVEWKMLPDDSVSPARIMDVFAYTPATA
jgi:hypothetical protein